MFDVDPARRAEHPLPAERTTAAPGPVSRTPLVGARNLLALQRQVGNRAVSRELVGDVTVSRQVSATAEADGYISSGDWARAASSLAALDASVSLPRLRTLSATQRQYLTEGAQHIQASGLIALVDGVDHRDAVIGSVRFFVWKHLWTEAGTYLCGLNDPDIRAQAAALRLTYDDLRAIADAQPKPQQERLSVAFFSNLTFLQMIPKDLVDTDGEKLAQIWLAADPLVAPYAAAKWATGRRPVVTVIPAATWADHYTAQSKGKLDPDLGRERTPEEARLRSIIVDGFTDSATGNISMRQGDNKPGVLIHEMIHSLAGEGFRDLNVAANEGATEYFARHVARTAGKHPSDKYGPEHAGIAALAAVVGDGALASAFFTSKTLAMEMFVDDRLGSGKFRAWREAMGTDPSTAPATLTASPASP